MLKQTNINIISKSCSRKKTRYDDPRKLMKQTSFTVKNLGGNLPKMQSTIVKRSFRSSIEPLSLDSTIPIEELTAKTFYHFRTSELFNIWMPPFLLHGSQYMTNSFARIPVRDSFLCMNPSTWLTHQLEEDVGRKVLHFINNDDQEALDYKTPKAQRCSNFFRRDELGQNCVSGHNLLEQTFLKVCATCELFDGS